MDLTFLRVSASVDLAEWVGNFWFMRGEGPGAMPDGHRILPDGCMEFVFQLGDPFRERQADGTWRLQPHLLLVGQMERRVDIEPSGSIQTVGVHFRPAGASAFLPGSMGRFTHRIEPLGVALEGQDIESVVSRLRSAPAPQEQVEVLEQFLRRRRLPGDPAMSRAATRLSQPGPPVDFETLAREAGLSERQFRRRFEAAVGLRPKSFARIVRFQRVFEQRQESDARAWSEVALDCGYYDQAHFNRDFRAFTGVRPRDLVRDADPLTAFFLSVSSKTARGKAE